MSKNCSAMLKEKQLEITNYKLSFAGGNLLVYRKQVHLEELGQVSHEQKKLLGDSTSWGFLMFAVLLSKGVTRFCSALTFKDVCIASSLGRRGMFPSYTGLFHMVASSAAWSSKLGMGVSLVSAPVSSFIFSHCILLISTSK